MYLTYAMIKSSLPYLKVLTANCRHNFTLFPSRHARIEQQGSRISPAIFNLFMAIKSPIQLTCQLQKTSRTPIQTPKFFKKVKSSEPMHQVLGPHKNPPHHSSHSSIQSIPEQLSSSSIEAAPYTGSFFRHIILSSLEFDAVPIFSQPLLTPTGVRIR